MSNIHSVAAQQYKPRGYQFTLIVVSSLFFMWGFITCLNDILIPYLKNSFSLSYFEAMLVQFCFFAAYFIVSVPAGSLVARLGYQHSMVTGLAIAGIGCLLFIPASDFHTYALFLFALFFLASGIAILQVAANPYVSLLGPQDTASSRLNLTQAFNSLGTTIAPMVGGVIILGQVTATDTDIVSASSSVQTPYLMLGALLFCVALLVYALKLPELRSTEQSETISNIKLIESNPILKAGLVALFLYVGAEVAIGSLLVNYLTLPHISSLTELQAAKYVTYYWGAAMVGRFIGAGIMQYLHAGKLLLLSAVFAILLLILTVSGSGDLAFWAVLAIGLCNSIMFPTIFSLSLQGLGAYTSQASGLLCLTIVGGAIIPLLQGWVADAAGLQSSFVLPIFCYLIIGWFAWVCLHNKS